MDMSHPLITSMEVRHLWWPGHGSGVHHPTTRRGCCLWENKPHRDSSSSNSLDWGIGRLEEKVFANFQFWSLLRGLTCNSVCLGGMWHIQSDCCTLRMPDKIKAGFNSALEAGTQHASIVARRNLSLQLKLMQQCTFTFRWDSGDTMEEGTMFTKCNWLQMTSDRGEAKRVLKGGPFLLG